MRSQDSHLGFQTVPKIMNTSSVPIEEHFSQTWRPNMKALENKSKMSQPIRGRGDYHVGYRITLKRNNTS